MNRACQRALCAWLCASALLSAAPGRAQQGTPQVDAARASLYGRPGPVVRHEEGASVDDGAIEVRHAGNEISVDGERFMEWTTSAAAASSAYVCDGPSPPSTWGSIELRALRQRVEGASQLIVSGFGGASAEEVAWAAQSLAQSDDRPVAVAMAVMGGGVAPAEGVRIARRGDESGADGDLVLRLGDGACGMELEVVGDATTPFDWRGRVVLADLTAALERQAGARAPSAALIHVGQGWSWSDVFSIIELLRRRGIEEIAFSTRAGRGSLSREVIRRVIRSHIGEVTACYEQALTEHQGLEGRVTVRFVISGTGDVSEARISINTMGKGGASVQRCVAAAVQTWHFPAPEGGGIVIVTYPFVMSQRGP